MKLFKDHHNWFRCRGAVLYSKIYLKDNNIIIKLLDVEERKRKDITSSLYSFNVEADLSVSNNRAINDRETIIRRIQALGFKSPAEMYKAINYYIKIGRIRVEAGTYKYELFKGNPKLETIKSFHSNGEIIPKENIDKPYMKEGEDAPEFFNENYLSSFIYNSILIIKGGIYTIETEITPPVYRTVYEYKYHTYMINTRHLFGPNHSKEYGVNRFSFISDN